MRLSELAQQLGGHVAEAHRHLEVVGISTLEKGAKGDLTFLANASYRDGVMKTQATAVITSAAMLGDLRPPPELGLVMHDQPYLAWAKALNLLVPPTQPTPGVHDTAVIHPSAQIDSSASVGPYVVVGEGARIDEGVVLDVGVVVDSEAHIGAHAYLAPYCVVRSGCIVGARCQLEPHCVIGVRGFGYATDAQGQHHAVPQVGVAILEEEVEMGSHIAVDRGAVTETRLGRGTKMGNQSAIGHNAVTGNHCLMVGHNALAGSSSIGNHVILAGKAGVAGHIHVGDQTTVMAYSAVTRPIDGNQVIRGVPARDARDVALEQKALKQLPALLERIQTLEEKLMEEKP